jgi:hypothetical protein
MSNHQSDVARLREQIELECEAMQQAMYGPAIVGRHNVIQSRYEAIGVYHNELAGLVGEEQASNMMVDAYSAVMEKERR